MLSLTEMWGSNSDMNMSGDSQSSRLTVISSVEMLKNFKFPLKTESVISVVGVQGELTIDIDLSARVIRANEMMVIGPGHIVTGYKATDDFSGFSISATRKVVERALPYLSQVVVCFMSFRDNPVISISPEETATQVMFHDLLRHKLRDRNDSCSEMVVKRLGEAILYETLGLYAAHLGKYTWSGHKRGEELFYRFITLVEQCHRSERSIGFYSDKMCVTSKHLSSVIKEVSGRTAGEWIDSYVILTAKMILSDSDKSIQEISRDLNFPNQSFFGKYFKHHTGKSPRDYRKDNFSL